MSPLASTLAALCALLTSSSFAASPAPTPASAAVSAASAPTVPRGLWIPQLGTGAGAWLLLGADNRVLRAGDLADLQSFSEIEGHPSLAAAKNAGGQWGYLNTEGQWAIPPQWDAARDFTEDGLARVQKNELWGYVGTDLKIRIKPTWTEASPFQNGRAAVTLGNEMVGAIDTTGKLVVPARYRLIGNFARNGLARTATKDDRWGYINSQGNAPFDLPQADVALDFDDFHVAPVSVNGKWGVIDANGRWVLKPSLNGLDEFQAPGLAAFQTDNYKTGYIDLQGREVIPPGHLSGRIGQGLIRSGSQGSSSFSFINTQGKTAISGPFDWAAGFGERGPTRARQKGHWGLLASTGQWVAAGAELEPLVELPDNARTIQGGLSLWLHAAQAIEWKNEQGRTVFRLTQKAGPSPQQVVLQLQAGDKTVWASAPQTQRLNLKPFFETRLQDAMAYDNAELVAEAKRMLAAKPRKFLPYSLVFDERRDPYDLKDLDEDEQKEIARGAMTVLAETYVDEEQWGAYYFLGEQRDQLFRRAADQACTVLTAAFGPSQTGNKPDPEKPWPLNASRCAWQVGEQWLALTTHHDSGDGDFEHQVALVVVAKKP